MSKFQISSVFETPTIQEWISKISKESAEYNENQIKQIIEQLVLSGDIKRFVYVRGSDKIEYVPGRGVEEWKQRALHAEAILAQISDLLGGQQG